MKNANLSSEPLLCSFVLGQFKSGLLRLGYNHELCLVTKPPKFFDKWIKCIVLYSFRMITEYVWPMVSYKKEASCHVLWIPVECLQMKFQSSEDSMWRWLTEWIYWALDIKVSAGTDSSTLWPWILKNL